MTGKRLTDSRLSLLTGVHRKDVRRLRYDEESRKPTSGTASIGAQVIAAWLSLPEYCTRKGEPLSLYRLANQGEPSFDTLVERVSKQDLRARSLLDEWLRLELVRVDEDNRVHLLQEAFLPGDDFDNKAYFLGHNIHDHLQASTENMMSAHPQHFDRGVFYNNLQPESVAELREFSEQKAMEQLKAVNHKARQLQRRDSGKEAAHQRFRFGAYFFAEDQRHEEEDHDV